MESRGGINLIWKNPQLDASQEMEKSLYYRQGKNSQLMKNPSLEQIYQPLIWLANEQSIHRL